MDVERFLTKFILTMERDQARQDLEAVVASLSDDERMEVARAEGYRRALDDVHAALRTEVTIDRFARWLRQQRGR